MTHQKRLEQLEQNSAVRIALARSGKLDVEDLADAELEIIRAETPPEMAVLCDSINSSLSLEQLERYDQLTLEELSPDQRGRFKAIVEADKRINGAMQSAK